MLAFGFACAIRGHLYEPWATLRLPGCPIRPIRWANGSKSSYIPRSEAAAHRMLPPVGVDSGLDGISRMLVKFPRKSTTSPSEREPVFDIVTSINGSFIERGMSATFGATSVTINDEGRAGA